MKVCVVGTGYVGLTTSVCLAYLGHDTTCIDLDERKIETLRAGRPPIYEPFVDQLLEQVADRLSFTTDYRRGVPDADVVFIAVQTPQLADGNPDLQYLKAAAESVAQHLAGGLTVVVNKSTVPIGSGNWTAAILRDAYTRHHGHRPDKTTFAVASNPEFLREGTAVHDTLYPDRIVIGADDQASLDILSQLYRDVLNQSFTAPPGLPRPAGLGAVPLVSTDLASAELVKYAANAYLALKISYINEIAALAGAVGANITEVARGIGLDTRIGARFLQPGIGWGGSCFGKDTAALAATAGEYRLPMPIVTAARDVNVRQRTRVVDRLLDDMKILKGCKIGLLGLAFKPDTDDLRDAPAIDIANLLLARGARISLHDPIAADRFRREQPALATHLALQLEDVFDDADAVVLVTDWSHYLDLDWAKYRPTMRTARVLDGRHCLNAERLTGMGYRYLTVAGPTIAPHT